MAVNCSRQTFVAVAVVLWLTTRVVVVSLPLRVTVPSQTQPLPRAEAARAGESSVSNEPSLTE